jgi:hypothetical protein
MKALREHLRLHGAVHAVWTIAMLLGIVAALLLMSPNGNAVGEYIAFATSIASLVLAVVAIGHALIANQSFSETVGSLKTSTDGVQAAAREICTVSVELSHQSERLIGEFSELPPAVRAISARSTSV